MNRLRSHVGWYGHFFFHELIPIYPLYGILFVERGMSPFQLSLLFTSWSLAALLAEVPAGALADILPRKWLLVASSLLKAGTYLVWLAAPSFWGFWSGFILWGFSGALRSGTAEALLHDALAAGQRSQEYTRVLGRIRAAYTGATAIAMLGGSQLVRYGYAPVLWASVGSLILAALVAAVALRESPRSGGTRPGAYLRNLREGVAEAVRNPRARFLVVLSLTLLPLAGSFDEFVGPILTSKGFERESASALFALIYLVQIAGSLAAHRIRRARVEIPLLVLALAGACLTLTALGEGWAVPLGMIAFFGLFALASTLFAGKLQEAIQGAARATVTSVSNAALHVGGMATFLAFGVLSTDTSLDPGVWYVAAVPVVWAGVLVWLARRWGIGSRG